MIGNPRDLNRLCTQHYKERKRESEREREIEREREREIERERERKRERQRERDNRRLIDSRTSTDSYSGHMADRHYGFCVGTVYIQSTEND